VAVAAASVAVLAASCLLHAVSARAAIKAARATLVFIDRYPKKQMVKIRTNVCPLIAQRARILSRSRAR
jgi:hypothetical protein